MHALVRFDLVWAGESRHSLHKGSSHRARAGRTCKVPAGWESKLVRKPRGKRWPLWRKRVVTGPAYEPAVAVAIVEVGPQ